MDRYSGKEKNISSDDILKALDRFGTRSQTPSPIEDPGEVWYYVRSVMWRMRGDFALFSLRKIKNNMANICSFKKWSFS